MDTKNKKDSDQSVDNMNATNTEVLIDTNGENGNLALYNKVRVVPQEAQKEIKGGRLNGFTDINPMWRLKILTEQFGVCGYGWYYDISRMWNEVGANNEIAAFVEIDLYIRINNEWSKPIKGVGGSTFVANESKGLYTSDECFKMALTDAISTSCKALGVGADIYFNKDKSKYDKSNNAGNTVNPNAPPTNEPVDDITVAKKLTEKQINRLHAIRNSVSMDEETLKRIMFKHFKKSSSEELTRTEYDFICQQLETMKSGQRVSA